MLEQFFRQNFSKNYIHKEFTDTHDVIVKVQQHLSNSLQAVILSEKNKYPGDETLDETQMSSVYQSPFTLGVAFDVPALQK